MAPSTESESSVTATEEALATARRLAVGRSTILAALDVELVGLCGSSRRRRTKSASWQEERPDRVGGRRGIRRSVLVEETSGGKDIETFLVRLGEPLLSLEETGVNRDDRGVHLTGVVDEVRVSKRGLGVQKMVGPGSERDPLSVGHELSHVDSKLSPSLLD